MQAEYAIISGCAEQATWRLYYIALRNMPGTTGSGVIGDWLFPGIRPDALPRIFVAVTYRAVYL